MPGQNFIKIGAGAWISINPSHTNRQTNICTLIYIYKTHCINCTYVPTYVPFSRPNRRTNLHQILHRPPTNSGKVLNASMTPQTQPLDPGVPQTPKPKWVTGEKTLCMVKCPDGWRKHIKFFLGSTGAWLASFYIYRRRRRYRYRKRKEETSWGTRRCPGKFATCWAS